MTTLRDYQIQAVHDLRVAVKNGSRSPLLVAPCGAGKTAIGAEVIKRARERCQTVLFLAPRRELVFQVEQRIADMGFDYSLIMSGEEMSSMPAIQVASIATLHERAVRRGRMDLPEAGLVIIDECFSAGTLVDTPRGRVPIEDIRSDDYVLSAIGPLPVEFMSRKLTKELYEVRLSDGSKIKCTGNHPLFTESGWVEASSLARGSSLFRREDVSCLWQDHDTDIPHRENASGEVVGEKGNLLNILRQEIEESILQCGNKEESIRNHETNRAQAKDSRRERKEAASPAGVTMESPRGRVGYGARAEYWGRKAQEGNADPLQDRYSEPVTNDCNRSGRSVAQQLSGAGVGQKEGCAAGSVRVESVTRVECGSDEVVYNLKVRGHPSYFANGVLVHNCHEATFGRSKEILDHYKEQGAVVVGLTATPARPSDGRGLGEVYDAMIEGPTTRQLIDMGYLVPPRHFRGEAPDLEGVKVKGDYVAKEVSERMKEPTLIGSVVANWFRLASERQTLVFAHDVPFSRELCDRFTEHGIAAAHIDAKTPNLERREINERFHSGDLQVVCNVGIYVYGVDFPNLSAIVLAKPTKSIVRYLQMCGRGLRVGDHYPDCLILDHANCIDDCGFVDDEQPWTLDGKKKIQDVKKERAVKEPKEIECPNCGEVFRAKPQCPGCGHELRSEYRKSVVEMDAELAEVDRKKRKAKARDWTITEKAQFFAELKGYKAKKPAYKPGWPAAKYKERLGVWPDDPRIRDAPMKEPSPETLNWIKSSNIRNAKRREKQREAEHAT